ncbi:MAG: SoxR reducing system RseC family protein [Colwellia sp.]
MIKELANVVAIDAATITVTSQIKSTCSGCAQVDTCGSGQIAKALPQAKLTLTLPYDFNTLGKVKHGDCVVLALPEKYMLSSAAQVYLLPLLGLLTFSAVGQFLLKQHILPHELFALGFGLTGGYLGYRFAKYQQQQGKQSEKLQPKIIEVIEISPSLDLSK